MLENVCSKPLTKINISMAKHQNTVYIKCVWSIALTHSLLIPSSYKLCFRYFSMYMCACQWMTYYCNLMTKLNLFIYLSGKIHTHIYVCMYICVSVRVPACVFIKWFIEFLTFFQILYNHCQQHAESFRHSFCHSCCPCHPNI